MKNLLIFIGAVILFVLVGMFAFIYTHIKFIARAIRKRDIAHLTGKLYVYYYQIAFGFDQTGNVICRDLFNDWFLKNKLTRKEYGNPDVTVSHVTGVNEHKETLTFLGRLLAGVLNTIDPKHTEKARNNEQYNG